MTIRQVTMWIGINIGKFKYNYTRRWWICTIPKDGNNPDFFVGLQPYKNGAPDAVSSLTGNVYYRFVTWFVHYNGGKDVHVGRCKKMVHHLNMYLGLIYMIIIFPMDGLGITLVLEVKTRLTM